MEVLQLIIGKGKTSVKYLQQSGTNTSVTTRSSTDEISVEFERALQGMARFAADICEMKSANGVEIKKIHFKRSNDDERKLGCIVNYTKTLERSNRPQNAPTPLVYIDAGMTEQEAETLEQVCKFAEQYAMGAARKQQDAFIGPDDAFQEAEGSASEAVVAENAPAG
jgi:hypothetical protein